MRSAVDDPPALRLAGTDRQSGPEHAVDREVDLRRHGGYRREIDVPSGRNRRARRHLPELVQDELVYVHEPILCGLDRRHGIEPAFDDDGSPQAVPELPVTDLCRWGW